MIEKPYSYRRVITKLATDNWQFDGCRDPATCGIEADVYDVLVAWNVSCPARHHAIKKLLMAGQRGVKSTLQDLEEARDAVTRAIELERARS